MNRYKIAGYFLPESLKRKFKRLPIHIRKKFYIQIDHLLENPFHPSLRNKAIHGVNNHYEFSLTMNYRVTYVMDGDIAVITNIGKHEDVF